jgi:hypothetical protein
MVGQPMVDLVPLVSSFHRQEIYIPSTVLLAMMRRGVVKIIKTSTTSLLTLDTSKVDKFEDE